MKKQFWAVLLIFVWVGTAGCATIKTLPAKEIIGVAEEQSLERPGRFNGTYVTTSRREGARQPFLLLRPERPLAAVILFTGGDGIVGISPKGIRKGGNFLVASRFHFVNQDFLVAIVDPPTDQTNLDGMRTSKAHALDIKGVIAYLRKLAPVPVWLVGTSYGSVSAVKVADWLADGGGPDGVVLTSSLFVPAQIGDSVLDADPERLRVPMLIVHHRKDRCHWTPFSKAGPYLSRMVRAKPSELIPFEGGGPVTGNYCAPRYYHGFPGIRKEVVTSIANWIKAHPPR